MSFIEQMQALSIEKDNAIKKIAEEKEAARKEKEMKQISHTKNQLMQALTDKYHKSILIGIQNASKQGKREKYINFDREDFKANCKGLGFPKQVEMMWLEEMCTSESSYLPEDDDGNKKHFKGIKYNIWNNAKFTTHFTW